MLNSEQVGFTMRVRPGLTALVVTCAVVGLAGCNAARQATPARTARVLVYNIHAGKDAGGVDNLERIATLVDSVKADIVLLQEVDRNTTRSGKVDQPATLARLTGFNVAFGKSLDFQGGQYGIAVMSRWPITADTTVALPIDPPQPRAGSGGSYEPRAAIRAIIAAPGGALAIVNTHLDASPDDRWRRQEIRMVIAIVDSLRARGIPTLAGGDINSTPESDVQAMARAAGLRDAWPTCGSGDGLTYPADSGTKRIDYLYLTGSAACTSALVVASRASDHRPVLFIVRDW
jgi:endonuclease/exonuclease/phosphatase family metal-dependent hydrolase